MEFSRYLRWCGMTQFLVTRTMLVSLNKVQWLHFAGAVDKFVIVWCDVSSGFSVPKILKSVNVWLSYLKKFKVAPFLAHPVYTEIFRKTRLLHFAQTAASLTLVSLHINTASKNIGFGLLANPFQLTHDFSNRCYLLSLYKFFFRSNVPKKFLFLIPSTPSAYWYRCEKFGLKCN